MIHIIISFLINAGVIFLTAQYLLTSTVHVDSFTTAIVVAIVLGVVNAVVRPIIFLFTLPLTIFTLGLFTFVINALMVLLVDFLIPGFEVQGFVWALAFSLIVSIVSSIINKILH